MNHSYAHILAISILLYLSLEAGIGFSQPLKAQDSEASSANSNANFNNNPIHYAVDEFVMGADLSYVNQILDHQEVYRDSGVVENAYQIFREYGTNVVRLRLWHSPDWVQQEVYPDQDVMRAVGILGKNSLVEGYPATLKGQRSYMTTLTREVIEGGGSGLFYWEPAWISSNMQDLWGTGHPGRIIPFLMLRVTCTRASVI